MIGGFGGMTLMTGEVFSSLPLMSGMSSSDPESSLLSGGELTLGTSDIVHRLFQ